MHTARISFVFVLSFICTHSIFSMDKPRQDRGLIASIVHRVNQELYPLEFCTDDLAPIVANEISKFNPKHPQHELYKGDATNKAHIKSTLSRHRKGLQSFLNACNNQDPNTMEILKKALENMNGYFSLNQVSAALGFWETRTINTNQYLGKLRQHIAPGILEGKSDLEWKPKSSDEFKFPDEKNFPSYEQVKAMVLESHQGPISKLWHWIVKNYIEQVPYLLDKKSQIIAQAMLHLHPNHPHHTENWKLNLNDKFHLYLIYQGIEREYKLSYTIEEAVMENDLATLMKLDPNNPENLQVMGLLASFYPPVLQDIITGCIHKVKCDKEADEQKRRDQEEQVKKSHEINLLINSLNKKISDPKNQEKLKTLSAEQRSVPTAAGNKFSHRGAGLSEIREAHQALTDFEKIVNQLLESPSQPSVPSSASAATSPLLPQTQTSAASQTMVDTSGSVTSTTPAAPVIVQQIPSSNTTSMPAPQQSLQLVSVPVEPPAAAAPKSATHSPSSSIAPAPDATTPSPNNVSPQASPPRTPGGSLVISQSEDEFNPRSAQASAPAPMPAQTPPAAAKQSAEPKAKNRGRKT